jgi:hypothetical protein
MLDGLESVPWPTLRHAYGEAGDIPGLLLALTSADAEEREEALGNLEMALCPQHASVTEAAAPAIRFLVAISADREMPARVAILKLLGHMVRVRPEGGEEAGVDAASLEQEQEWVQRCRSELREALGTFCRLLADRLDEVKIGAAFVLSGLAGVANVAGTPEALPGDRIEKEIVQPLLSGLRSESSAWVKSGFALALADFGPRTTTIGDLERDLECNLSEGPKQALALVLVGNGLALQRAVPILVAGLRFRDEANRYFDGLPWIDRHVRFRIVRALVGLPLEHFPGLPEALIDVLARTSSYNAESEVLPILGKLAGDPGLEAWLRKGLTALAENDKFWKGSDGGRVTLRRLKLPDSPDKIRAWRASTR